jgi:hypothetical protein
MNTFQGYVALSFKQKTMNTLPTKNLQTSPSLERNSFVGVSEAFEQC